jgi:hypothetical protein
MPFDRRCTLRLQANAEGNVPPASFPSSGASSEVAAARLDTAISPQLPAEVRDEFLAPV